MKRSLIPLVFAIALPTAAQTDPDDTAAYIEDTLAARSIACGNRFPTTQESWRVTMSTWYQENKAALETQRRLLEQVESQVLGSLSKATYYRERHLYRVAVHSARSGAMARPLQELAGLNDDQALVVCNRQLSALSDRQSTERAFRDARVAADRIANARTYP